LVAVAGLELLERVSELKALRSCVADAVGGSGRLVVVDGEPGIGKTELLRAARDEAREGMQVLTCRGSELERELPFGLVRQLFEPALRDAGASERAELLAGAAAPAGAIVDAGDLTEREGGFGEPLLGASFAALYALFWLTSNLCEGRPLVLSLDDFQWADAASLRFCQFLAPRLDGLRLLVVMAVRTSEGGAAAEWAAGLGADPAVEVLRPGALSARGVSELVFARLGEGADDGFCTACHEVSGGNPFLLRELLASLRELGIRGAGEDIVHVREIAPPALRQVVLVRLARLGQAAQRLARALSVLGDGAELRAVAALAELELDVAARTADAMVAEGTFEAERPLRYRHPLLRTAVYADIPPMERAGAHARAAELLARTGGSPDRVAAHLMHTEPAGREMTVSRLTVAAQQALERAAPDTALRFLARALDEPPPERLRGELVRLLLVAGWRAADRAAVEAVGVDPLAVLGRDEELLAGSAWHLAMFLLGSGRAAEVPRLLGRAVETARSRGDLEQALQLDALLVTFGMVSPAQAHARLERYAEVVPPGSASERLWLALQAHWASFLGESAAHAGELARRGLDGGRLLLEQPDTPVPEQAILVLARCEQLDLGAKWVEGMAIQARQSGSVGKLTAAAWLRAYIEWLRGDVAAAEVDARGAVEAARQAGVIAALPMYAAVYVDALVERDDLDCAEAELAALGWTGALPESYWWSPVLYARASLHLARRHFEQAAADLTAAQSFNERQGISSPSSLVGSRLALALAGQGRVEEARKAAHLELEQARSWGTRSAVGGALRVIGTLSPPKAGLDALSEAVSLLEGSSHRLEYMRALADYGAALRRAKRTAQAREPLRRALEMARRGGAIAIGRRAHAELEATGERSAPPEAVGAQVLTPSERRVAELAAEGLSNREIAQSLFLTVKTVEGHLTHAYRKLDVHSRTELPDALAE
jgi:DNA-binding CsgD family transcriptional regulator/tetratricopeptide (TPR) repeat protein